MPRVVGVDYGTKRVGLAVSDPLRLFAQPFGTFPPAEALEKLKQLHDEDGLAALVIGWPLTEAGAEGKATERVRQYLGRLRRVLPGVEIIRWDERYTSEMAKDQLRTTGWRHDDPADRGRVDAAAAGLLLQEYLDSVSD